MIQNLIQRLNSQDDTVLAELDKEIETTWFLLEPVLPSIISMADTNQMAAAVAIRALYYMNSTDNIVELAFKVSDFDFLGDNDVSRFVSASLISQVVNAKRANQTIPSEINQVFLQLLAHADFKGDCASVIGIFIDAKDTASLISYLQGHHQKDAVYTTLFNCLKNCRDEEIRTFLYKHYTETLLQQDSVDADHLLEALHQVPFDATFISSILNILNISNKSIAIQLIVNLHTSISATQRTSLAALLTDNDLVRYLTTTELDVLLSNINMEKSYVDLGLVNIVSSTASGNCDPSLGQMTTLLANAILASKTMNDGFFTSSFQKLKSMKNWSQFMVSASLGSVFALSRSQEKIQFYLPFKGTDQSNNPYSDGGALFALGMIYADYDVDRELEEYLLRCCSLATSQPVKTGLLYALGLIYINKGLQTPSKIINFIYEQLINSTTEDEEARYGEAAAIAAGLIFMGRRFDEDPEYDFAMIADALDNVIFNTDHPKLKFGAAIGAALTYTDSRQTCENFLNSNTPEGRLAGVLALALSYQSTANLSCIKRLLKVSVSDSDDKVRFYATFGIGLVCIGNEELGIRTLKPLLTSYHPATRSAASLICGIFRFGTGDASIHEPLKGSIKTSPFIAIAESMLFANRNSSQQGEAARKFLRQANKDPLHFYASSALAMLNFGGSNHRIVISDHYLSLAGAVMFSNLSDWLPSGLFISLLAETNLAIYVKPDMTPVEGPVYKIVCPPSLIKYPPLLAEMAINKKDKLIKTKLSFAAKEEVKEDKSETEAVEGPEEVIIKSGERYPWQVNDELEWIGSMKPCSTSLKTGIIVVENFK